MLVFGSIVGPRARSGQRGSGARPRQGDHENRYRPPLATALRLPYALIVPSTPPPRLLDLVRAALRLRHLSRRTEKAYVGWIRRFILFHAKRHPIDMGAPEITRFLSALATERNVSASTQNQALAALLFLYRNVLDRDVPWLDELVRARRPARLPVVLSRDEVGVVLRELEGVHRLMATLLYGAGLRLLECARLRVKDVDFGRSQITVRGGKGDRDRLTVLPATAQAPLARHLVRVRHLHEADLRAGAGWVELPAALARKYPHAGREWVWQWIFPATRGYLHRETGQHRRHHLHESVLQRAVRNAAQRAAIPKRVTCHTFRHRSPHISWRTATTSARCRRCSATRTCARP